MVLNQAFAVVRARLVLDEIGGFRELLLVVADAPLAAGEYWVLKKAFGWSMERDPGLVVRAVLVTFNLKDFPENNYY